MTGENKQLNCESSLKDELNKNIKLFKSIGQPSYLINQMIWIEQKVSDICYKIESEDINIISTVNSNIYDLEIMAGTNSRSQKYCTILSLSALLETLSENLICNKLHPAI